MHVAPGPDGPGFTHHGGCTIILSPEGEVRFVVLKNLLADGRVGRRRDYLLSELGQRHWRLVGNQLVPLEGVFRSMHAHGRS